MFNEIKNLRNITVYSIFNDHAIYRYAHGVQKGTSRIHYPLCISDSVLDPNYRIYDYSEVSNMLLNAQSYLTYIDIENYYMNVTKNHPNRYYIDELSFDQVQNIINNNVHLFAKVNNRLQQDILLAQICEQ